LVVLQPTLKPVENFTAFTFLILEKNYKGTMQIKKFVDIPRRIKRK
jgi:hypothetical protein